MATRNVLSAVLAAALLSGCLYQPADDRATHSPSPPVTRGPSPTEPIPTTKATPTPPPPSTPVAPVDEAPKVSFSAAQGGGDVPLEVTFTGDATDPEGSGVWWWFDAHGDGTFEREGTSTSLPVALRASYTSAGLYPATFRVGDGKNLVDTVLEINATPAPRRPIQHVEGSYVSGLPDSCTGSSNVPGGFVGFDVDERTHERGFTAVYDYEAPPTSLRVTFYNAARLGVGEYIVEGTDTVIGTVPSHAVTGVLTSCGGAQITVQYDVY